MFLIALMRRLSMFTFTCLTCEGYSNEITRESLVPLRHEFYRVCPSLNHAKRQHREAKNEGPSKRRCCCVRIVFLIPKSDSWKKQSIEQGQLSCRGPSR